MKVKITEDNINTTLDQVPVGWTFCISQNTDENNVACDIIIDTSTDIYMKTDISYLMSTDIIAYTHYFRDGEYFIVANLETGKLFRLKFDTNVIPLESDTIYFKPMKYNF